MFAGVLVRLLVEHLHALVPVPEEGAAQGGRGPVAPPTMHKWLLPKGTGAHTPAQQCAAIQDQTVVHWRTVVSTAYAELTSQDPEATACCLAFAPRPPPPSW